MGYASPLAEAAVFLALADPTRRAILTRLRERELSVNAIAGPYAMSRPAVSKHLRVLRRAGLVREERSGRQRFYRLAPEPLRAVDRWLEEYRRLWSTNLARLKTLVETEARRGQARNRH
jgi:DNA-binding transcriptional ArsR family regulator